MNDYRNDPNNRYGTEYDAREQAPQQLYGQAQFDAYSRGAFGEYTFKAKKKTPASKKILTGIIAVLCVAAIGTTSIVGYTLITGNNVIQSSDSDHGGCSHNDRFTVLSDVPFIASFTI